MEQQVEDVERPCQRALAEHPQFFDEMRLGYEWRQTQSQGYSDEEQ